MGQHIEDRRMSQAADTGRQAHGVSPGYVAAAIMIWIAVLYSLLPQVRPQPVRVAAGAAQACLQAP